MQCAWFRNENEVKGNSTYRWDEARFLVCNFWYMMAKDEKPFFFLPKFNKCSSRMKNKILHGKWWSKKNFNHPTS